MKTIILYGELAKRFGKTHRFAVKNAAEAIRALKANFRDFENYMCSAHLHGVGFKMFIGGTSMREYKEIHNPVAQSDIIRLVPVIVGSGSGWVRIFVGAVLVTAAVALTVFTAGTASQASIALGALGLGLIIGGVSQLLTKPPEVPTGSGEVERKNSYIFNGPANTAIQGSAVPVGYGRMIVGSKIVSAGIETYEE